MKYLIFNWKMNPASKKQALGLFKNYLNALKTAKLKNWKIIVSPPFVYLTDFADILKKYSLLKNKVFLAGQNCFWEKEGPYTGEISPAMLKNIGIKYVILGHSERRRYFQENAKIVSQKANLLKKQDLKPIICWGEKSLKENPEKYLKDILKNIPNFSELFLAYEPIWAIGTGKAVLPEQAKQKNHLAQKQAKKFKSKFKKVFYLYGGSVNSKNISQYLSQELIDGFLIGGASLKKQEVLKIFKTANNG